MGQMGNQMFQYACALELSHRSGYLCSLDDISKLKYFKLGPLTRACNWVKQKIFFHIGKRFHGITVANLNANDLFCVYKDWLKTIESPTMIWGFFQSQKYFEAVQGKIRQHFRVKKRYKRRFREFLKKYNINEGGYACMHFRRADYQTFTVTGLKSVNFVLPDSYYKNAMQKLRFSLPLIVVSDDPSYCREFFKNENVVISDCDSITDFLIISNARQIVISNSTFSWWAAWLNPFKPVIYCPQYFLGFKEGKEVPVDIYPENWIQLPC